MILYPRWTKHHVREAREKLSSDQALHTAPKCMHRQVVGHLGKNELAHIQSMARRVFHVQVGNTHTSIRGQTTIL